MKRYIRSTNSIGNNAADQIQRFINGYGFSKFCVYPRTDEYLAIDVEGEDEDEVISLLNRLHAWGLDADVEDHYVEINIADDDRFGDAVTASDVMNPGWSKRYDRELQETYYVLAIPRRTATVTEFDNDGDWGYDAQVRCKDIDCKKSKTFYGPDSLDAAMTWAENELYKTSVTSAVKYNNEGNLVSVDGWDVRTGLIKRIDRYLSTDPKATAPVGYVDPHSRDYESLKAMYGDYVVTPFKNIKNADLIAYADDHGLLDDK